MACIYNGSIFFVQLSVLLLNLYLSFLLLLKFLFKIKWGVGMRFKVLKYYDKQENGTIEMVSLLSHHHWGTLMSFWCFTSKLV